MEGGGLQNSQNNLTMPLSVLEIPCSVSYGHVKYLSHILSRRSLGPFPLAAQHGLENDIAKAKDDPEREEKTFQKTNRRYDPQNDAEFSREKI